MRPRRPSRKARRFGISFWRAQQRSLGPAPGRDGGVVSHDLDRPIAPDPGEGGGWLRPLGRWIGGLEDRKPPGSQRESGFASGNPHGFGGNAGSFGGFAWAGSTVTECSGRG